jgi:hypothetical protein
MVLRWSGGFEIPAQMGIARRFRTRRRGLRSWVVDELPHYSGPIDPANRKTFGALLSLAGLASMALATALLLAALSTPALAVRLDGGGSFPPGSAAAVHTAQAEVIAAALLVVLATVLAFSTIAVRSAIGWRLIGGLTLVALVAAVPLLWFTFAMAF